MTRPLLAFLTLACFALVQPLATAHASQRVDAHRAAAKSGPAAHSGALRPDPYFGTGGLKTEAQFTTRCICDKGTNCCGDIQDYPLKCGKYKDKTGKPFCDCRYIMFKGTMCVIDVDTGMVALPLPSPANRAPRR